MSGYGRLENHTLACGEWSKLRFISSSIFVSFKVRYKLPSEHGKAPQNAMKFKKKQTRFDALRTNVMIFGLLAWKLTESCDG